MGSRRNGVRRMRELQGRPWSTIDERSILHVPSVFEMVLNAPEQLPPTSVKFGQWATTNDTAWTSVLDFVCSMLDVGEQFLKRQNRPKSGLFLVEKDIQSFKTKMSPKRRNYFFFVVRRIGTEWIRLLINPMYKKVERIYRF